MPTSQARTSRVQSSKNSKGFTLLEIMFGLTIIAFVVAIAIPKLGRSLGTQVRSTTRRIIVLNKELHSYARLKNKTYRLVIDFGDKEHKPHFYVESATSIELLPAPDASPMPEKKDRDGKVIKGPFSPDTEILKKPFELPEGAIIEDVENDNSLKPITEGKAYIVFFPQGLVQRTVIHITDGKKMHWSLIVNPLTGHTDLKTEYFKLKDLDQS